MPLARLASFFLIGVICSWRAEAGPDFPASGTDKPVHYIRPPADQDFIRRAVEIPMRDGIKLHTVIVSPKGVAQAPIVLTRTPYGADRRTGRQDSGRMDTILPRLYDAFVSAGYIVVIQDVRGMYGSEGGYVMARPPRGPLNPTAVDNTTDAWDSIDWLVKNVSETNGRVGMIGSSYDGNMVAMALLDPHPALKVAAPLSPMGDGWMGDDWFHYGAFRQGSIGYIIKQESPKGADAQLITPYADDYEAYLRAGSAGDFARMHGGEQFAMWNRLVAHPAYDAYWQGQALDKLIVAQPSRVPTLWLQGLWDQEDMWGAVHIFETLEAAGKLANNYLAMGPWRHSQITADGRELGPLKWSGDTAGDFRRDMILPFFNLYLKDGAPNFVMPHVQVYNTGNNRWDNLPTWPLACDRTCPTPLTPLYLADGFQLSFDKPMGKGSDDYISDPSRPVPFTERPISATNAEQWQTWLVSDQRGANSRTDVLSYETQVLDRPVRISGAPVAELRLSTTGTDGDFVVKLIDVYPSKVPDQPELGGYQLGIAMDIFRGRYRESFEKPTPFVPGKVARVRFALPNANHVFKPGHRIMIQIQSSWFPLYDRNPQTFVPNIFNAKPEDYRKATITLSRSAKEPSAIWLPIVEGEAAGSVKPIAANPAGGLPAGR